MKSARYENLLTGFEPDFDFEPAPPIPEEEFADRLRRIRREAMVAGDDLVLIHAGGAGRYTTTNGFLRYACDWPREGVLVIPTDPAQGIHLLSFFTESVLLPPPGEPIGIEAIWQVGAFGREYAGRPGRSSAQLVADTVGLLKDLGFERAQCGTIGDGSSGGLWASLSAGLSGAGFHDRTDVILRMQRVRTEAEQAQIRTSAQLIDIGYQAACHVAARGVSDFELYAAVTFAQLARGGESGDGYQIGVNQWGTHCGKPYGHHLRDGDLVNFYFSAIPYHGYTAQTARMMAVGEVTPVQEETLAMCTEAVERASALIAPGVQVSELHEAAFATYLEHGYLQSTETATMPYNWAPMDDGSARRIPDEYVADVDYEQQGRRLMHVYPPVAGPHNPNLGHSIGKDGIAAFKFNVTSHNTDVLEPGMVMVLHAQWLDPLKSGANIGDCYLVTEDGFENLSCHSRLETFRITG